MRAPRLIFYSHDDGLGTDHLRRNLSIAAAVTDAAPDATVLLVTSATGPVADALAPNVDVLALPDVRRRGLGRHLARGLAMSGQEVRALRTRQIEAAVGAFRPDLMLVDTHPLGVGEELRPALDALLAAGGRAALGLRDVIDDPAEVVGERSGLTALQAAEAYFERLLVYGDRRVLDFVAEYRLSDSLAARVRYCGYIVHSAPARGTAEAPTTLAPRRGRRPLALVTAGGGGHDAALLASFVQAAHGAVWDGVVSAGAELSDAERHALRRSAVEAGVEFHVSVPDVWTWFQHVDVLVCTAEYSTISEAIWSGTPTLCVPDTRKAEQMVRARSLGRLGLLHAVEPELLDPALLRNAVGGLLGADRRQTTTRNRAAVSFDGARRATLELLELPARWGPGRSRI